METVKSTVQTGKNTVETVKNSTINTAGHAVDAVSNSQYPNEILKAGGSTQNLITETTLPQDSSLGAKVKQSNSLKQVLNIE